MESFEERSEEADAACLSAGTVDMFISLVVRVRRECELETNVRARCLAENGWRADAGERPCWSSSLTRRLSGEDPGDAAPAVEGGVTADILDVKIRGWYFPEYPSSCLGSDARQKTFEGYQSQRKGNWHCVLLQRCEGLLPSRMLRERKRCLECRAGFGEGPCVWVKRKNRSRARNQPSRVRAALSRIYHRQCRAISQARRGEAAS